MTERLISKDYADFLENLKTKVSSSRYKAARAANCELILLYHHIGSEILRRQKLHGWGAKVIDQLSQDLGSAFPEMKGFSARNLKYMRQFSLLYKDVEFVQQVVAQLPWGHNVFLMDLIVDEQERLFYIHKAIEHGWSRNIMVMQIEKELYRREGKAISNFKEKLPSPQSDLAQYTLKDPYIFDFLTIGKEAHEREIEKGLVQHIEKFLLELGAGFAFVGRQYHLEVGDQDFYIDLLFYHLKLRAFVVIELKEGDFKPEYAGKINFYLSAVDDLVKHPSDNPSIGLILCRSRNKVLAEYALRDMNKPIGLAEYKLTESLPETFKTALPTIEELEKELSKDLKETSMKINLTQTPEVVTLKSANFVYIEKIGPFMKQAPLAWQEFWEKSQTSLEKKNIIAMLGLSMIDKKKKGDEAFIYQAGVTIKPKSKVPAGLKQRELPAGKYARFLLTGAYSQLADAYPQAFDAIAREKLFIRNEFCMESYLNTPIDTAEEELKTEILIPID